MATCSPQRVQLCERPQPCIPSPFLCWRSLAWRRFHFAFYFFKRNHLHLWLFAFLFFLVFFFVILFWLLVFFFIFSLRLYSC